MSVSNRRTALAVALMTLLPTQNLWADELDAAATAVDPAEVETITVTSDPFSRTTDRLIQPAEILDGEELARRRGASLGETLEHELGVSSTDFGRGAGRPVIRGQAGPRVLMLENGMASMDASEVSADHEVSIDPAHAEQVEILKGPATLFYGSSASAGVVNVVNGRLPARVREGVETRLGGNSGSNGDERAVSGSVGYGIGSTQLHLDAAWLDADDYDIPGHSAVDGSGRSGTLGNSAVEKTSGSLSAAQFWTRGALAASYGRFESVYGLPVDETAFIDLEQDRYDIEARLRAPVDGLESVRLRLAHGRYEHTEFEAPGEAGTVFRNAQDEGRVEFVHATFAGFKGVLGVQRRDRAFQAIGDEAFLPSTDTRSLGLFLVEQTPLSFGSFELGLRSDREVVRPREGALRERVFNPVALSGGVLVELDAHHHLKFYGTRAQRAPVTEELYSFGPHLATGSFERGNDAFGLETASNVEVSLDRHGDALSWRLNLYAQRIADYLYQREVDAGLDADGAGTGGADGVADRVDADGVSDPAGELLLVDYDAGDARFWGAEGELGYAWNQRGTEMRAQVSGDLARGRISGGGDLPRITPARLGAGLHAHRGPWSGGLDLTQVMRQDRIASLETDTAGYAMLAADLNYGLTLPGGTLALFLRGRNLLDEEARRHTSFIKDAAPLPGVSVLAGFEWRIE